MDVGSLGRRDARHVVSCHVSSIRGVLGGMTEHETPHKVVVIGGGHAGTLAANHLRVRTDVDPERPACAAPVVTFP